MINPSRAGEISGLSRDGTRKLRAPPGVSHVILDTPGGLRGLDLARVVAIADAILMPVCNSVFDRESAADCYAELMALPRVASGRCKVTLRDLGEYVRVAAEDCAEHCGSQAYLEPVLVDRGGACQLLRPHPR